MQHPQPDGEPQQQRALVLEHWNSWVRVWLPATGETRWVDLEEQGWTAEGDAERPERDAPTPGVGTG
ncbi:MAG: hypothetical protein CMJ84_09175 [Planctomycetes bacterium]|jgi:hypothetical protein|nr:hypothetical protein [Planctomycetota bacterium]MDP6408708.1 hypothetical protein [Planctomycetota bacterium]